MESGGHIELTGPDGQATQVEISGRVEFGRENGDVVVGDPAVSRRHLLIEATDEGWYASDLGSSNGTTINGRRIGRRAMLSTGDEIRIGDTRLLVHGAPGPKPIRSVQPTVDATDQTQPDPGLEVTSAMPLVDPSAPPAIPDLPDPPQRPDQTPVPSLDWAPPQGEPTLEGADPPGVEPRGRKRATSDPSRSVRYQLRR